MPTTPHLRSPEIRCQELGSQVCGSLLCPETAPVSTTYLTKGRACRPSSTPSQNPPSLIVNTKMLSQASSFLVHLPQRFPYHLSSQQTPTKTLSIIRERKILKSEGLRPSSLSLHTTAYWERQATSSHKGRPCFIPAPDCQSLCIYKAERWPKDLLESRSTPR